jgi:hypothetical protein
VAARRSFRQAADDLEITPSAISQTIRGLFPEIGRQPLEDLQASAFRDAALKIERPIYSTNTFGISAVFGKCGQTFAHPKDPSGIPGG